MIPGVVERGGLTYRRFKVQRSEKEIAARVAAGKGAGKWKDHYVRLPDPDDPDFSAALDRANGKTELRRPPAAGTISALILEKRAVLARTTMADNTREAWRYYLKLIDADHGDKPVALLRKAHVFRMRDKMADTPGKANNYLAKLRGLLEFAVERDWIAVNPARGVPNLETGEHEPWPAHVLEEVLKEAEPMMRLAIISGLCSGQRVSDCIVMQHGWMKDGMMDVTSIKTKTAAFIPMHPVWIEAVKAMPRKAVTILYDRSGKPFYDPKLIQERMRRLMHRLGHVDGEGQLLYTFHGLGKNACCYLTELGLSEGEISAIVGKTPETVRHYAKRARAYMMAKNAADRVTSGKIVGLR